MIEGLHFDISTNELKAHLEERAKHHKARREFYVKQAKDLDDDTTLPDGTSKMSNTNNNPVAQLKGIAKNHGYKATKFDFMAAHLTKDETYRLSESDLVSLELVESQY